MYLMGRNAIENGSRDTWTMHPSRIDGGNRGGGPPWIERSAVRAARDRRRVSTRSCTIPRRAIRADSSCSADQPDFLTATKFVNTLIKAGVVVHRATGAVHGRRQDRIRPGRTWSRPRRHSVRT